MTWMAFEVTLYDGTRVLCTDPAWARECEARFVLGMDMAERAAFLELVRKFRGQDGFDELRKRCFELEPAYVLITLPDREARRAYLDRVEARFGIDARKTLEGKVRALHEQRQGIAPAAAAGA